MCGQYDAYNMILRFTQKRGTSEFGFQASSQPVYLGIGMRAGRATAEIAEQE